MELRIQVVWDKDVNLDNGRNVVCISQLSRETGWQLAGKGSLGGDLSSEDEEKLIAQLVGAVNGLQRTALSWEETEHAKMQRLFWRRQQSKFEELKGGHWLSPEHKVKFDDG